MSVTGQTGADQLRQYIERIERLEEESVLMAISEISAEAKATGLSRRLCAIIKIRGMDKDILAEEYASYHLS